MQNNNIKVFDKLGCEILKSVSYKEFFSLMFLFEIGSAILFALGISAKQDAWLSVLIAMILALPLIYSHLALFKKYNANLAEISEVVLGKILGKILSFIYAFYFLYIAARVTRDFTELSIGTISPKTPVIFVPFIMGIVVIYYLLFDISVTAKSANILLPIFIFLILFRFVASFSISGYSFSKITPVLENGIVPVIKAAFPEILTFPFGELIAFLMIFPDIPDKNKLTKVSLLVVILIGILLSINNISIISAIGPDEVARANFPSYQISRLIQFGSFKNLDTFYAVEIVIGGTIKIIVFTYAGIKCIQSVFNLNDYKFLLIPVWTIVYALPIIIASTYQIHIILGLKLTPIYLHIPFQIIIPILLLLISLIKKRKNKRA